MRFIRFVSLATIFVMIVLTFSAPSFGTDQAQTENREPEARSQEPDAPTLQSFQKESQGSALLQEVTRAEPTDESDSSDGVEPTDKNGLSSGETQEPAIAKTETKVSGLIIKAAKKARSKFTDTIKISPAYGRTVLLQMKSGSKWVTKKTYKMAHVKEASLKMTYPNDWWKKTKSSWRLVIAESEKEQAYASPTITITTKRYYQTPGKYFKVGNVPTRKSGYTLKLGMSGLKVYKVQKKLGCYYGRAKYTSSTAARVKAFQRKKGLKATGHVNKATWLKMGFSEKDWYYLDSYVTPIKVDPSSTREDHINAMVKTAKEYMGTKYIWCASARPGQGVDCAGLVLQCLYAAGIDPLPSGSHVYAYSRNEYTTRRLWANKKFKHVPWSQKRKGDIIVYHNGTGVVNHVSLYIGGGMEIESLPGPVRYSRAGGKVKGVLRPII